MTRLLDIELPQIPVGEWVESAVDWLTDNLGGLFEAIQTLLELLVQDWVGAALHAVPAVVLAVVFALIAWACRNWKFGLATLVGMLFIQTMGMWEHAMDTLALTLVAAAIAMLLALPLGVLAARSHPVSEVTRHVLDFLQTMPVFVYLIPAVFFFGVGVAPGVVATIVFAMPPGVRLTELGIRQVDQEMVEAGHAFGATPRSILTGIQVPLAMPTIMAGVNQVIMLALSMVVVAGMVGAGGLGSDVYAGITRLEVGQGFEGGIAVVIVAIFLDRATAGLGNRSTIARSRRQAATA
jgi:ABC-type proline/glycine betaine transport system permease subunit